MASDETIPTRRPKKLVVAEWFNILKRALSGDFYPRNSSGVASDEAGSLGSGTYLWLKAFIASGHWMAGDVKIIHPYNGDVAPGHGWMLMDGRVINEANYDVEHGAGSWDTYVGTSPLDGKKLPDFTDVLMVGAAATTQDGSGAFTKVGNASHQVDMEHLHQWFKAGGAASPDVGYDLNGDEQTLTKETGYVKDSPIGTVYVSDTTVKYQGSDLYTAKSMSSPANIQPESIEFQIYMRVIP